MAGTREETLGPNKEYFLEKVKQTLMRGDEYEQEYRAKVEKMYQEQGIPWSGLQEVYTATGDGNWQYTYTARKRDEK